MKKIIKNILMYFGIDTRTPVEKEMDGLIDAFRKVAEKRIKEREEGKEEEKLWEE
jgi:hypothetical protein